MLSATADGGGVAARSLSSVSFTGQAMRFR